MLRKETEDTNKWQDVPYSWIRRIIIVKMPMLPKAVYRLNATPIKIPRLFFPEIEQYKFCTEHKRCQIAQETLRKKNKTLDLITSDFKLYYKTLVIKTAWY